MCQKRKYKNTQIHKHTNTDTQSPHILVQPGQGVATGTWLPGTLVIGICRLLPLLRQPPLQLHILRAEPQAKLGTPGHPAEPGACNTCRLTVDKWLGVWIWMDFLAQCAIVHVTWVCAWVDAKLLMLKRTFDWNCDVSHQFIINHPTLYCLDPRSGSFLAIQQFWTFGGVMKKFMITRD